LPDSRKAREPPWRAGSGLFSGKYEFGFLPEPRVCLFVFGRKAAFVIKHNAGETPMSSKPNASGNGMAEARSYLRNSKTGSNGNNKFLTFFLGTEEYGIEILKVQEIISMMTITPVPRTPHFVRGVINLRGKVITVVDLRLKFEMEAIAQSEETCIIVVQTQGIQMGCIVDKVSEVLDINAEEIEDPPSFGIEVNTEFILGVGKSQGKVKLLLNIDKVLSSGEMESVVAAKNSQDPAAANASSAAVA
jgi:purine-binding chemotaxis protein CheW